MLVLWVLVAMSLLALSFSAGIRAEVDASRNVVEQKQAYYLTRAGIEYAVYKILQTESAVSESRQQIEEGIGQVPEILTGQLSLDLADGTVQIEVIDEAGKLNLNSASPDLIYNLMIMIGVSSEEADVVTDSILDWRDQDDMISPNGAEAGFYQSLDNPYYAKNGAFDVTEELLLVRGVTPEMYYGRKGLIDGERADFYGLQNYFTTFTLARKINVNSAPVQVLAAIPGLDYQDAVSIFELRSGEPLENVSLILERIPGLPTDILGLFTTERSNTFTIDARGSLTGSESVSRIRAVVRVDGQGPRGYSVLYWNEANTEL